MNKNQGLAYNCNSNEVFHSNGNEQQANNKAISNKTNNDGIGRILDSIRKTNLVPIDTISVYYSDDVWDLKRIKPEYVSNSGFLVVFDVAPPYKDLMKDLYIVYVYEKKLKINSITMKVYDCINFLNFAYSKGSTNIEAITPDTIQGYMNLCETDNKRYRISCALKDFFEFYNIYYAKHFDVHHYDVLIKEDPRRYTYGKREVKTQEIPDDYYKKFLRASFDVATNENEPVKHRGMACLYLILSQTGLRISELLSLKSDCLQEVSFPDKPSLYYMCYSTFKKFHKINKTAIVKTPANKIVIEAYNILLKIYAKQREEAKSDYLFFIDKKAPVEAMKAWRYSKKYVAYLNKYFPTVTHQAGDLKGLKYQKMETPTPEGNLVIMPTFHQFRVHYCTKLCDEKVDIMHISQIVGHESSNTTMTYVKDAVPSDPNKRTGDNITTEFEIPSTPSTEEIRAFLNNNRIRISVNESDVIEIKDGKKTTEDSPTGYCISVADI